MSCYGCETDLLIQRDLKKLAKAALEDGLDPLPFLTCLECGRDETKRNYKYIPWDPDALCHWYKPWTDEEFAAAGVYQ